MNVVREAIEQGAGQPLVWSCSGGVREWAMQSKRDGLIPIGEALADLPGPVKALRKTPPPARRGFTVADQVNQLVGASEAAPDLGFMARLLALCSLPRSNPGNRLLYKRVNGPYRLYMQAGGAALWQWVYPSPGTP